MPRSEKSTLRLNKVYLFKKMEGEPFRGFNEEKQVEILREAYRRYLEGRIVSKEITEPEQEDLKKIKSATGKLFSDRTLKNHQEDKNSGFQSHVWRCIVYGAGELKREGKWDIDLEELLKVPSVQPGTPPEPALNSEPIQNSNPENSGLETQPKPEENVEAVLQPQAAAESVQPETVEIIGADALIYRLSPARQALMAFGYITLASGILGGVYFSPNLSLWAVDQMFLFLSALNGWVIYTGWQGNLPDSKASPLVRNFVRIFFFNTIAPHHSYIFGNYSEVLLLTTYIIFRNLGK